MFNKKLRKSAERQLELTIKNYDSNCKKTQKALEELYLTRVELQKSLDEAVSYVNLIKNKPMDIETKVNHTKISMDKFQNLQEAARKQYNKDVKTAGSTAVAGAAAGVGFAALAPSAAMAIATSVGTASTGAAISTLSGAAATNAALAWLGGGALTAGGAGIAGGSTLVSILSGPAGWVIGGAALTGSALALNGKNKKAASELYSQTSKVKAEINVQIGIKSEAWRVNNITLTDSEDLKERMSQMKDYSLDYLEMNEKQKDYLLVFVNNIMSSSSHLNWTLGKNHKFS